MNFEELFIKQVRDTRTVLSQRPNTQHVSELPNPLKNRYDPIIGRQFHIKDLSDDIFGVLDDMHVSGIAEIKPQRFKKGFDGKPTYDDSGSPIMEDVHAPSGSMFIRTEHKVEIPYQYKSDRFAFANAWMDAPDGKRYIYAIPKENLYEYNLAALVVSRRNMAAFRSFKLNTWSEGALYLCVIPYRPNMTYINTAVLAVKCGLDFYQDIVDVINTYQAENIIPHIPVCSLSSGGNLVINEIAPAYMEFAELSSTPLQEVGESQQNYSNMVSNTEESV